MSTATIQQRQWGTTVRSPEELREAWGRPVANPVLAGVSPLQARRLARAKMLRRRRRTLSILVGTMLALFLAWPAHAFGDVKYGNPTLGSGSQLNSGMTYVVQPGDSINTIATMVDPGNPAPVRAALLNALRSDIVTPGEHVLIP